MMAFYNHAFHRFVITFYNNIGYSIIIIVKFYVSIYHSEHFSIWAWLHWVLVRDLETYAIGWSSLIKMAPKSRSTNSMLYFLLLYWHSMVALPQVINLWPPNALSLVVVLFWGVLCVWRYLCLMMTLHWSSLSFLNVILWLFISSVIYHSSSIPILLHCADKNITCDWLSSSVCIQ